MGQRIIAPLSEHAMLEEKRNEVVIAGVTFDLSHLAPKKMLSKVTLPGNTVKDLPVEVAFTMHCWSRGLLATETEANVPATHLLYDGKEPRLFCERRHRLSLQLPALVEKMLTEHPVVYPVKGGNFVHFEMVEELEDGTTLTVTYLMILQMRKSTPDKGRFIKLRVETAYPEDLANYDPIRYDPKGFHLEKLLRDTWTHREGAPKPGKSKKRR